MSAIDAPKPISIHIPASLSHLTVPLAKFLERYPKYRMLAVGACIFSPSSQNPSRLLLIQRAATERSFPNLWEIPGGSSEFSDPTVLHSVAREVFEETGLHLTKFVTEVGDGIEFRTSVKKLWLKLSFEIEVAELNHISEESSQRASSSISKENSSNTNMMESVAITLDPEEHQNYAWVIEEDLRNYTVNTGPYPLVTEDQRQMLLEAFVLHGAGKTSLPRTTLE